MQETVSCIEAVRRAIAHLGNKYSVQLLLPRILSTTQASVQIDLIVVTHGREVLSEWRSGLGSLQCGLFECVRVQTFRG